MTCSNSVKEGWSYSGLNNTFFLALFYIVFLFFETESPSSLLAFIGSNFRMIEPKLFCLVFLGPSFRLTCDHQSALIRSLHWLTRSVSSDQSEASSGSQVTNQRASNHWPDTFTIARATNGRLSSKFPSSSSCWLACIRKSKKNPQTLVVWIKQSNLLRYLPLKVLCSVYILPIHQMSDLFSSWV